MATQAYIDLDRVKAAMPSNYAGCDDVVLSRVTLAASAWLDNYCNRSPGGFLTQSYDELYHGTGTRQMFTRNAPIQSISRISTGKSPALSVMNTSSDMATIARVSTTPTGLTLSYQNGSYNGGVAVTNTFAYATYVTVQSLADAINAVGNHWTAQAQNGLGNRNTGDLWSPDGSFGCRITNAYLWCYWFDLPSFAFTGNVGEVYSDMGFTRGVWNYRVGYTAGFTSFPEDLAQALSELVVAAVQQRALNGNLKSETIGDYSYTKDVPREAFAGLSDISRTVINRYKLPQIGHFSTW